MRLLAALLLALAASVFAQGKPAIPQQRNVEDFDALWKAVDQRYAYFEGRRGAWRAARDRWRPRAAKATNRTDLAAALDGLLAELRDDHVSLAAEGLAVPRRVPTDADLWASWKGDAAVIEAVRTYGEADVGGMRPNDVVVRIDGRPVEQAVRERLGKGFAGPAARDWALRQVLAGPRAGEVVLELREGRGTRRVALDRAAPKPGNGPPLLSRRIGVKRDLGYIRIKAPLDDARVASQFDAALTVLSGTRALIVDLRETSGGATHEVTRGILGRFVLAATPWQIREAPGGKRETDTVERRGLVYTRPVLVLVDRWTAGEGEALAAGFAAVAKAKLVGTEMAGWRGELAEMRLPHSNIVARFPAQKTLHVDGTPRERLRPEVVVDLVSPQAGPGDPILYRALKLLEP
jgi:carboxyl-terminal processing protease